jgi:soluble lytic murein transglycosylase
MPTLPARAALASLVAAALLSPAYATPLPVPKPEPAGQVDTDAAAQAVSKIVTVETVTAPVDIDDAAVAAIRAGLSALDLNNLAGARAAVEGRTQIEQDLVTWLAIRRQVSGLSAQAINAFADAKPHWPSTTIFRRRSEQAMARSNLPPLDIIAAFGSNLPLTDEGTLALVRAMVASKRAEDAARVLAPWWAREPLSIERERAILKEFGDLLGRSEHKARFDMLMFSDRMAQAEALAPLVGETFAGLATARRAVLRREKDAARLLDRITGDARDDPLFAFTLAELHRHENRDREAAATIMSVPPEKTVLHADEWWIERRIVSRGLIEAGDHKLAYDLVKPHRGGNPETVAEAYFHAGWYALRFLKDPAKARPHFKALQASVTLPLSRSRAAYWLGRTEEAAGDLKAARMHYTVAAADEATFYGQLARVKLSRESLDLPPVPVPTDEDRLSFRQNDLARAMVLLVKAGARADAMPLATELARQLPSGGQVAILVDYLTELGDHRAALQVGKVAADRNLGTEGLAFPLEAIPESGRNQKSVEIARIYAIARQESAFDPAAVSHAGAMGLLQLLPTTAQATAKTLGLPFSRPRLTSDADYNATLGAAHLRELVDRFKGSYILTFAAYNAGPRRAYQWIERFGDPRDPEVDPVDWIEMIPFGETRSYVQRVTENLQVYRERLGSTRLEIVADLKRGG